MANAVSYLSIYLSIYLIYLSIYLSIYLCRVFARRGRPFTAGAASAVEAAARRWLARRHVARLRDP